MKNTRVFMEYFQRNLERLRTNFILFPVVKQNRAILFHIPTLSIYEIDENYKNFFEFLLNTSAEKFKTMFTEYISKDKENYKIIKDIFTTIKEVEKMAEKIKDISAQRLSQLTLLVSQRCTMDCLYCYAKGGTYGQNHLMNAEVVKKSILVFYKLYDSIEKIKFFGGEPLLNIRGILSAIYLLRELHQKGFIKKFPVIEVVTGLGVEEEIIGCLIKMVMENTGFNFEILVSMDGPEDIQNLLRPMKGGKPSFEIVDKNLRMLRKINQPKMIGVTFTKKHLEMGFTEEVLIEFFHMNYGIDTVKIEPVITDKPELEVPKNYINDDIYEVFTKISKGNIKVLNDPEDIRIRIRTIVNKIISSFPKKYFCDAGITSFAVTAIGDVYPCYIVAGNGQYLITNVNEPVETIRQKLKETIKNYRKLSDKDQHGKCKKCYLRYFCNACTFETIIKDKEKYFADCKKRRDIVRIVFENELWRKI
ncbi:MULTISPECIES: radical SAM/SPASM domain-containing protein [unclassified Thermosipho (in: thermotogales)]|uniref:radical SAM/SPASM domain-containing protein n=1 Tax=unclassified Thermosipho (in: thermotogales) TaxID=2676525 RepID=UPI000949226E|nr:MULTISPECIES: radical SAM protein [unclassified Thermosipho (in: thermotogales)]ANQ54582.1 hypothetical protein Y592_03410 [Thermosipho sp. 1070]OOC44763.1 hypothetical protein XO08_03360 [Thermosipho sp. 1074]